MTNGCLPFYEFGIVTSDDSEIRLPWAPSMGSLDTYLARYIGNVKHGHY